MELRAGYKQTDVGVIPEDWDVKCLGELGKALIGLTYRPTDICNSGTLVLRSSNVQSSTLAFDDNVFVDPDVAKGSLVEAGDILICARNGSRDLIGKCAFIDESARGMAFGAFMAAYRSPNSDFIFFQFQSDLIKRQINEHLGATINQITNRSLLSFKVALPRERHEQRAIAAALSDADALIASLDALIAKKRDLKQAVMQQLLTGKTRLPGFNGEWEERPLGEIGRWQGGGTPRMSIAAFWTNGTIPWASSADIKTDRLSTTPNKITENAVSLSSASLVPRDAILVVTRSGILRRCLPVAICEASIAINQDIKALLPRSGVVSGFIFHSIVANGPSILSSCMKSGTTVESIDLTWLKRFTIRLPVDTDEQAAIAAVLSDMDADLAALEAKRDKVRALKQGMMQELLTGRIRLI